ncbi:MAG: ChaN family lipoprotein [Halothece sp.]
MVFDNAHQNLDIVFNETMSIKRFCALSFSLILFCALPACSTTEVISSEPKISHSQKEIIQDFSEANVIYLGETHDSLADHSAQLEIIQALYSKNSQIAIAMEMFQRPYQTVLDQYLDNKISEEELRSLTEYDERWGFDWEYYAPILRFAKAHSLPILALNTPSEVTRKVAREGLESLTEDEKRYIPPLDEIHTDNEDYREMLREVYSQHAHGNSSGFERFFAAQVLWDETMAEAIAEFHQSNPNYQVIVLAGQGHIVYGYGIPNRVKRRVGDLVQSSVLLNGEGWEGEETAADYIWNTQ